MIDQAMNKLETEINSLKEFALTLPWEDHSFYSSYLKQTHTFVTHSCKLLEYSANKLPDGNLKSCMLHHIEEELNHERLAEKDLKKMGYNLPDIETHELSKHMYERIYAAIDSQDAAAPLIGYALALEGLSAACALEIAERIDSSHGKGKASFLKLHGEVDQDHSAESKSTLSLLNDSQIEIAMESMEKTKQVFVELFSSIAAHAQVAA